MGKCMFCGAECEKSVCQDPECRRKYRTYQLCLAYKEALRITVILFAVVSLFLLSRPKLLEMVSGGILYGILAGMGISMSFLPYWFVSETAGPKRNRFCVILCRTIGILVLIAFTIKCYLLLQPRELPGYVWIMQIAERLHL